MNKLGRIGKFAAACVAVVCAFGASAASTALYVQNGLIAHWDGYDNAATGKHVAGTTEWVDLVAGRKFKLTGVTVNDDRLTFAGTATSYGQLPEADTAATFDIAGAGGTIEIVLKADTTEIAIAFQSPTMILAHWETRSIVYSGTVGKPTLDWGWDNIATNTVSLHYETGLVKSAAANGSAIGLSTVTEFYGPSGGAAVIGTRQSRAARHFKGSIYAIRIYNRALTQEEITANRAVDVARFDIGDYASTALYVSGEPENVAVVEPGYGLIAIADGAETNVSASAVWTNATKTATATCKGWLLYDESGTLLDSGDDTTFVYRHPDPAAFRQLVWQWDVENVPVTLRWTGKGADNKASTAENWDLGFAPTPLAHIVLDGADADAQKSMTWDLDVELSSWTQDGYTGTVTFETVYGVGFDCLEVAGDVTVASGTWKHKANSGTTKSYRLNVSVGGDFTLGANAKVDVSELGYTSLYKENAETLSNNYGGGYGGWGGTYSSSAPQPYGRFYAPDLPGSAGSRAGAGGGVFNLACQGQATIDGVVKADGKKRDYYSGSGGSIWIICGEICGSGSLSACASCDNNYSGAGGRIAVKLTKPGADFSEFDLREKASAYSSSNSANSGAPGTVYGETAADTENEGWLIVRGRYAPQNKFQYSTPFTKDVTSVRLARLTLGQNQHLCVATGQTLDLSKATVERYGGAADKTYVEMTGGTVVVDPEEFTVSDYVFKTTCGWAPSTERFVIQNSGRYLLSGASATSVGSLELQSGGYAELNADLVLVGGVSIASGTTLKLAADKVLSVGSDWLNAGTFTAATGSTVTFAGTADADVAGTTSFANVTCTTPGKSLAFADDARWNVSGTMKFEGVADDRLSLAGTAWTLDTSAGAASLKDVNVSGCSSVALLSIPGGEGENNTNISFVNITPGEVLTWTGLAGTVWLNAGNWTSPHDGSRTPVETDNIVIPAAAPAWPELSGDEVTVGSLTTAAGSTLSLKGFTLRVNGTANLAGNIDAAGGGFSFGGDVIWTGASVGTGANVLFDGTGEQSFAPAGAALGAVTVLTPDLTVDGSLVGTTVTIGDGAVAQVVSFVPGSSVTCDDFLVNGDATAKNVRLTVTATGDWLLKTRESRVVGAAVSHSDARESWTIETVSCNDEGGNQNWRFVDTRTHYAGGVWPALDADAELVIDRGVTATLPAVDAIKSLLVLKDAKLTIDASVAIAGDVRMASDVAVIWNKPATIGGELYVGPNSLLTHAENATIELNRLDLTVTEDVTLAKNARIDVVGKGFTSIDANTIMMGNNAFGESAGASHGGRGYYISTSSLMFESVSCYGSVFAPTNVGCCGAYNRQLGGGGAVHVKTLGRFVVDGEINASAKAGGTYYSGAGGSVWLEAASFCGAGKIIANGGDLSANTAGAGGRISLVASAVDGLSVFTGDVMAYGGSSVDGAEASPGSVYLNAGGVETVRIENAKYSHDYTYRQNQDGVDLPSTKINADDIARYKNVTVELGANGTMNLMQDLTIKNLVYGSNAKMKLNGHVLKVRTRRPKDWPETGLPSWVDAGGTPENPGRVEWQKMGLVILFGGVSVVK